MSPLVSGDLRPSLPTTKRKRKSPRCASSTVRESPTPRRHGGSCARFKRSACAAHAGLFVCLLVCSFVCWFVRLFVYLLGWSAVLFWLVVLPCVTTSMLRCMAGAPEGGRRRRRGARRPVLQEVRAHRLRVHHAPEVSGRPAADSAPHSRRSRRTAAEPSAHARQGTRARARTHMRWVAPAAARGDQLVRRQSVLRVRRRQRPRMPATPRIRPARCTAIAAAMRRSVRSVRCCARQDQADQGRVQLHARAAAPGAPYLGCVGRFRHARVLARVCVCACARASACA